MPREQLATRLGFLLVSAGCAVGIGNIWRFGYITGQYGGAAFVIVYLVFLVILGFPVMVMEFSMGRAAQRNLAGAMTALQPPGSKWSVYGHIGILGNLILMMFYTTVAGWTLAYLYHSAAGHLIGKSPDELDAFFGGSLLGNPLELTFWVFLVVLLGYLVCALGLKSGVERVGKTMMGGLFILLIVLAIRAVTLPGAGAGLDFYLRPQFQNMTLGGVYAAMSQAFFTLSLGIGSMAIFGSYIGKHRALAGESIRVIGIDTFVALMAGLIIFSTAFAFGVDPGSGAGLVFITLPNIFNEMMGGQVWSVLFFLLLALAAMTTVVAVFENLTAYAMDQWNWTRKKTVIVEGIAIFVLSMPVVLGFNVLSSIQTLPGVEGSTFIDLWDFIVSYTLLPVGSLVFALFCSHRFGWGWDNFLAEANSGDGMKFPAGLRFYCGVILPLIIAVVLVVGYLQLFGVI
ncbi:MAG: sodium-dependent transporter [Chloroflexota bacterium]